MGGLDRWISPPPERIAVPDRLVDVSADYLSTVLSRREKVEVAGVTVAELTEGSGTRARLELEYRSDTSLPKSMWLKTSFHEARDAQRKWRVLETEARFYQLAPYLTVRVPQAYYAGYDGDGGGLILLEDLGLIGATFNHVSTPLSLSAAESVVDALASLHASAWDDPVLDDPTKFGWLDLPTTGSFAQFLMTYSVPLLPRAISGRRSPAVPAGLTDGDRVAEAVLTSIKRSAQRPHCLLHYDPHVGNTYLDKESCAGLLDWQLFRKGRWSHDFAYFVAGALAPEDRRRWESQLLDRYLSQLAAEGVPSPPTSDVARVAYAESVLYGFFMWITTPTSMVADDTCCEFTRRYGIAAVDLSSLELLTP